MTDLFESLKPFIWPTYYEEGPPRHVQLTLLGDKLLTDQFGETAAAKSVLELMTLGYRPVTMLAILKILHDSAGRGMHGMEVARGLEKGFSVPEGYFTRSRYYTDRVGKVLNLMVRLGMVEENLLNTGGNHGRKYPAFRIRDTAIAGVRKTLETISQGEPVSLFSNGQMDFAKVPNGNGAGHLRTCQDCGFQSLSLTACFCELCGKPLNVKCDQCGKLVLASFSFCNGCGSRLPL